MPDVRFFPFVYGTSMSQSVVTPFKHHTVGSMRGNVRWDLNIPVGAKGLSECGGPGMGIEGFGVYGGHWMCGN